MVRTRNIFARRRLTGRSMPTLENAQNVDVGFDPSFIDKWLRYEKYPWAFIALFILAAFAGLLGRGPLAKGTAKSGPEGLEVRYERVARNKTPASLEIRIPHTLVSGDVIRMRIEGDLLNRGKLQRIIPQPQRSQPLAEGITAEFPRSTGTDEERIVIAQEPGSPGRLWNRISIEGGPHVDFQQIVLP